MIHDELITMGFEKIYDPFKDNQYRLRLTCEYVVDGEAPPEMVEHSLLRLGEQARKLLRDKASEARR